MTAIRETLCVEVYDRPRRLLLYAEMRLPGRAGLQFEVTPGEQGSSTRQTAIFDPLGFADLLYCFGICPLHQFVFAGIPQNLGRAAEGSDRDSEPPHDIVIEATASETHPSRAQL